MLIAGLPLVPSVWL